MCVMALWKSSSARKFTGPAVDKKVHPAHIAPVGAPTLGAMARLRSSSLNIRWQSFRLRSAAGGFDALWSPEGRGHSSAPGCLTSESEERETWTAESLRAASSTGEGLPSLEDDAAGRDKAVHVSRNNTMSSFVSNHARRYMLDLVNVNVAARKRRHAQNV